MQTYCCPPPWLPMLLRRTIQSAVLGRTSCSLLSWWSYGLVLWHVLLGAGVLEGFLSLPSAPPVNMESTSH